ncbi:hypothetical protein GBAR_LOCUS29113, partial [Geodia barretti]
GGSSVCLSDLVAANVQLLSLFPQSTVHGLHQLSRASPGIQLIVKVLCSFHQTVRCVHAHENEGASLLFWQPLRLSPLSGVSLSINSPLL